MNHETKVGLFLMVAIGAILASIVFLGNVCLFQRSHRYFVDFKNVEALPPKAAVKIAGVEIGKVRRVELVDGRARVTIDIKPQIKLHSNSSALIGSTGIIGTKFVELDPGTEEFPVLNDGDTIKGLEAASLNEMFKKISALFEKDEKHGDVVSNLKETIANIRNVSRALDIAMGQHAMDMEAIVINVRDLTQSAKVVAQHLEEITTERKEDFKVAIEKFRGVGEKLDDILAKVKSGQGMLGALVSDEKAGKDVKEAVASIKDTAASAKKVLGRFTMINTYWNIRYRYDFKDDEGRTDLGLTFVPRPGKFYGFGVTNVGEPIEDEKHLAYERKNRIVAVLGKEYGPFTGYAGAIRSRGGAGLSFRPLMFSKKWYRRFELNAEASDFSRDRTVKGHQFDRAFVSAGAHMALTKWLWIGARAEDLLERAAFQAYTNIVFRDEDLAYFFGFASFSK
jgi:phospholipid/cholesterol/gamma-HCH transport system substrate-binding protein